MRGLKVLVAPSGFKESLAAEEVASAIAEGLRRASAEIVISQCPLVDGGEGFTRTLVRKSGGSLRAAVVSGPRGERIESFWGIVGGAPRPTAVIEMAAAAGLRLIPPEARDPLTTTTYGVGELITAALDAGMRRILLGCGDSGTNDGGVGLAQALGIRFRDNDGKEIARGGVGLLDLAKIELGDRHPGLDGVEIDVACNMHNVLCGPRGVARVFGPQKGASDQSVQLLERALERYAEVIERSCGIDVRLMPGSGASGGLGTALHTLLGARLRPRFDVIGEFFDIESAIDGADVIFTAEGGIDGRTLAGKVPAEIALRAARHGIPVVVLVGTIGPEAARIHAHGIASCFSILCKPCTLDQAYGSVAADLALCAEQVMRAILAGERLGRRVAR